MAVKNAAKSGSRSEQQIGHTIVVGKMLPQADLITDWTYYCGREQIGHTIVVEKMLPQADLITDWTYYCGRENAANSKNRSQTNKV